MRAAGDFVGTLCMQLETFYRHTVRAAGGGGSPRDKTGCPAGGLKAGFRAASLQWEVFLRKGHSPVAGSLSCQKLPGQGRAGELRTSCVLRWGGGQLSPLLMSPLFPN